MKPTGEIIKMTNFTKNSLKNILIEIHRPHGLLEKKGWDIPLNFYKEIETANFSTLKNYFDEIVEFLNGEV